MAIESNIKNMRLLSGEELVVELVEEAADWYVIKNPVGIMGQQEPPTPENPKPQPKLGFVPWAVLVEPEAKRKGFKISKSVVVYCVSLQSELEAGYRQLFGKLVLPGSGQRLFKPE